MDLGVSEHSTASKFAGESSFRCGKMVDLVCGFMFTWRWNPKNQLCSRVPPKKTMVTPGLGEDEEFQMDNLDTAISFFLKTFCSTSDRLRPERPQVFQDSAVALPPLNPNLARKMLQEMGCSESPRLMGFHGKSGKSPKQRSF
jgi:hypothetical protein